MRRKGACLWRGGCFSRHQLASSPRHALFVATPAPQQTLLDEKAELQARINELESEAQGTVAANDDVSNALGREQRARQREERRVAELTEQVTQKVRGRRMVAGGDTPGVGATRRDPAASVGFRHLCPLTQCCLVLLVCDAARPLAGC